jgi:hypothetical protein
MPWHCSGMASKQEPFAGGWLDRAAIGLSGLCLLHCVATVLLVALAASAAGLLLNPLVHEIGLAVAIGLGLFAFGRGLISHGRKGPLFIGGSGLAAMAYALSLRHGVAGEFVFTAMGVCLVAIGHELNRRAGRARNA